MGWSAKKVLITGGLGFIGSNLAIRSAKGPGLDLRFDDRRLRGNFASIREIRRDVEVHFSDVRDENVMGHLVADREVVFHLAAQSRT